MNCDIYLLVHIIDWIRSCLGIHFFTLSWMYKKINKKKTNFKWKFRFFRVHSYSVFVVLLLLNSIHKMHYRLFYPIFKTENYFIFFFFVIRMEKAIPIIPFLFVLISEFLILYNCRRWNWIFSNIFITYGSDPINR